MGNPARFARYIPCFMLRAGAALAARFALLACRAGRSVYSLLHMDEQLSENTLLIVAGACLRAESLDRPLAYRVRDATRRHLVGVAGFKCVVLSDVWYLNSKELHERPLISIGGPGVNHVSGYLYDQLPVALMVEHVFQIQMDVTLKDHRCSVWGMDHETTVEAVETFVEKGHLDRFLKLFPQAIV
ncbi:MAG: hypothetical protein ACYSUI_03245 [Planctomycetota bacterium]